MTTTRKNHVHKQALKVDSHSPTIDGFWPTFRPFPTKFDAYCIDHWYLFVIGPYLALLTLDVFRQMREDHEVSISSFTIQTYGLSDWIVLFTLIAISLAALAFNHWRRQIPTLLHWLFSKKRIAPVENDRSLDQEYQSFLSEYQQFLHNPRRLLLVGAILILALQQSLPPVLPFLTGEDPIRDSGRFLINVLAIFVWSYFIAVGAWLMYATGLYIRKLTTKFTLNIQPSHPDRSGGLRPLGDFCLTMAVPLLIGTLFMSFFGLLGLLPDRAPITISAKIGLVVLAGLTSVAFLAPLWHVHRQMAEQKRKYEDGFADRVAKLEEKILTFLDKGDLQTSKNAKEELEVIHALHPDKIGYPVWPFDRNILIRFLTPQLVSFLSIAISLSEPLTNTIRAAIAIMTQP